MAQYRTKPSKIGNFLIGTVFFALGMSLCMVFGYLVQGIVVGLVGIVAGIAAIAVGAIGLNMFSWFTGNRDTNFIQDSINFGQNVINGSVNAGQSFLDGLLGK